MGYLEQSTINIDAILTRKGRELLASGVSNFSITQFALGDSEIDYSLYNPNDPLGSNFFGSCLENLPVLESCPDETEAMKYFLVTLPVQTTNAPYITVAPTSFTLSHNQSVILTPSTVPSQAQQYRAVLNNTTHFTIVAIAGSTGGTTQIGGTTQMFAPAGSSGGSTTSGTVVGTAFKVTSKNTFPTQATCIITIFGMDVGGSVNVSGIALAYNPGGIGGIIQIT